ncbi:MAG: hypothetical protein WA857_10825 [Candidatus Acidiferrum sp.]
MMIDDPLRQEDDLRDVQAEERSRGSRRRKLDTQEKNRAARLRQDILRAYREGDEIGFKIALLASGWQEDSPEFVGALKKFRDAVS